jgi:glycosyltransferase involved in cell wall biosynthesis
VVTIHDVMPMRLPA